ncbi:hypothetical protein INT46_005486 [Mucor plumbeus]|uniref:Uncharacterized protein n=1 Tax=Mucor plumbeus TaxID=97098 RepID=A0A8H7UNF8_9FUNG|nr:hypothetical protein INT46_005486 [Mucor plumbeus]
MEYNNGGVCPVFNLRKLNRYPDASHFKMVAIKDVASMIQPNDCIVSVGLSNAFLHVDLHPDFRKFLRLKWKRLDIGSRHEKSRTVIGQCSSNILQQLGWFVDFRKSVLTPQQHLEHLGFVLNTTTMTATLPLEKLRDIRRSVASSSKFWTSQRDNRREYFTA